VRTESVRVYHRCLEASVTKSPRSLRLGWPLRQTEVVAMVPEFGALAFLGDDHHHLAPPGLRAGVA